MYTKTQLVILSQQKLVSHQNWQPVYFHGNSSLAHSIQFHFRRTPLCHSDASSRPREKSKRATIANKDQTQADSRRAS